MPNKKKTRAPAKVSAPKLPAKKPAAPTPTPAQPSVAPLDGNVFKLLIQIIDNADFKGREVNQVLAVKLELARVAGLRQTGDGK